MSLENIATTDIHTFADPSKAVITHLDWQATINFDQNKIEATARYKIKTSKDATQIILDSKGLKILSIKESESGNNLDFKIGEEKEHLGRPIIIEIKPTTHTIYIRYSTGENAEALQWLSPVQTAGKKHPFLFTQSQAILARSWIPIQDSPGIRFTYNSTVQVPSGLLALMSAENPQKKNETGLYYFQMKQKIPAYLMALAVGDLEFQSLGDRTGVYAESSILENATYEFAETENMIKVAENLYGPYQWERYDLLVLPPSFPFGGMENPRLTFATPTILAGDRSLTSLVAHELAHSWSGNLVTNSTWNDFWLNEGFTVYFEQRIMEELYGRDYSEMLASLSLEDLKTEISEMIKSGKGDDTRLKLNLEGRNPDDGVTSVAYDKGYNFLRLLEETVGRDTFDIFIKKYFSDNAFKGMNTEGFVEYLKTNLIVLNNLNIDPNFYESWIYEPGLPANHPTPESNKFENVESALKNWLENENKEVLISRFESDKWSSHEWQHFVRKLPAKLDNTQMSKLDTAFGFTLSGNSEILAAWLEHVISNQYEQGYQKLEKFLINTGRRKFLTPLYKRLIETENGKQMAMKIYKKARPNYHHVSSSSIDAILKYQEIPN
ncbi:M1 family metallopeptidase [Reichenbachiella sp. MALMAid0571]|uniref:M1 family metallopeptidase n=1 Tax=Reichenbachiella sp. MALMAid0571 TaxID=3143939 RepID=UPI0032DFE0EB